MPLTREIEEVEMGNLTRDLLFVFVQIDAIRGVVPMPSEPAPACCECKGRGRIPGSGCDGRLKSWSRCEKCHGTGWENG